MTINSTSYRSIVNILYTLSRFSILDNRVFVFIGVLSIVLISYSIDPVFAVIIENKHEYGKLYFIGTQNNNDSLPTVSNLQDVVYYTNSGDELLSVGKYEEAITNYDNALAVDPNYIQAINNKGIALANLGRYEEALTYYDRALVIDPNYTYALNSKGVSLADLGRYEEAITYYDKVLEIDPYNKYATDQKAVTLSTRYETDSSDNFVQTSTADVTDKDNSTTANEIKTFRDSKTKVSFEYPSDWEVASDEYIESTYGDSEGFIVAMFPKSLDGSSFSVIYEELPFSMSAKEYVNIIEKSLQEEKDTSMSKPIPISIGSLDGYRYNVTTSDETLPGGKFVSTQIVFVKNSKAFAITYLLGAEMAKDLEDIESMIESFEINNSNKDNDNTEDDNKAQALNEEELENAKEKAKALLNEIFTSLFPQTGDKFTNTIYGVDISFPKNWAGVEMKVIFPMAVVSPEGFSFTDMFYTMTNTTVDNVAESFFSEDIAGMSEQELQELIEQNKQQLTESLTNKVMEFLENMTSTMGVFIYDKEFARLMNSLDQNNTKAPDSLTSVYERLVASDPTISCDRTSLDQITLHNNISAEISTEQCSYLDSNKKQGNLNYFVLTPNAIVGIQYTSDPNSENDKFLQEFDEALKTLSVQESLPINNQTIQQFLSG